jgi:ADP-heptose:LPS heptosyltransferase
MFRSLILLKPCCFGDVMLTTPLLGILRRAWPSARIDFAVGPHARAAIEANPLIDGRLDSGRAGQGGYPLGEVVALIRMLRAGRYDAIFVPDRSPVLALVAFLSGIPTRVGLHSGWRGLLYTHRVPARGVKHEADLYLDLARALKLPTDHAAVEYTPPATDQKTVLHVLDDAHLLGKPFILIHPGGGQNPGMTLIEKRWPPPNFAQLTLRLMRDVGLPVALVGGLGDGPILAAVHGLINIPFTDLGPRQWGVIGALAERCTLYIGNDTGATHMAVGAGARTVMVMGPSDPRRYAPFGPPDRVAYVWREWAVPARGVRGGAAGFSWELGATVDNVFDAALGLLPKSLL